MYGEVGDGAEAAARAVVDIRSVRDEGVGFRIV